LSFWLLGNKSRPKRPTKWTLTCHPLDLA
jgi:hypothetical protein